MDFQTRPDICEYMVKLIPRRVRRVLEPTAGEGNLVAALHDYTVVAPTNFWDIHPSEHFDAIVMNPPFSPMREGYKTLYRCMEMTSNIIALMPWLTLINSERRTKKIIDYGLVGITHLPRNAFAGSRVQTCKIELHYGYRGESIIKFY